MKTRIITFTVIMMLVNLSAAEDPQDFKTLTPLLGEGFGKIIEIEGEVFVPPNKGQKRYLRKKWILVDRIGARRLTKPLSIELASFSSTLTMIPAKGTQIKIRGYETGHFSGIPAGAFLDIQQRASREFHFKNIFQVTKLLKPAKVELKK
ncbi:MAG: hypothetical protein K0U86_14585 [Planctomycetes bacterium]|nr:hypothetical protein [Planctomycetota bacterium]MCH9726123.1 hypothetical protein [Planctomycetota bacterium]MCH9777275.1 hypothetical protein [Planctomycetota bacterium]MCH9790591.1 hypothetical protein [Planctomycetota bacterium]